MRKQSFIENENHEDASKREGTNYIFRVQFLTSLWYIKMCKWNIVLEDIVIYLEVSYT